MSYYCGNWTWIHEQHEFIITNTHIQWESALFRMYFRLSPLEGATCVESVLLASTGGSYVIISLQLPTRWEQHVVLCLSLKKHYLSPLLRYACCKYLYLGWHLRQGSGRRCFVFVLAVTVTVIFKCRNTASHVRYSLASTEVRNCTSIIHLRTFTRSTLTTVKPQRLLSYKCNNSDGPRFPPC